MLISTRLTRNAAAEFACITRQTRLRILSWTRWRSRAAAAARAKVEDSTITVTKHKYVDMPVGVLSPDGAVRKPLPPFDGGLTAKATRRKTTSASRGPKVEAVKDRAAGDVADELGLQPAEPPKSERQRQQTSRARITGTRDCVDGETCNGSVKTSARRRIGTKTKPDTATTGDEDHEFPVKRRRDKKSDQGQEVEKTARSKQTANANVNTVADPDTKSGVAVRSRRSKKPPDSADHDDTATLPSRVNKLNLAQEIRENLANFPHCILLTRVGNFYESYFEQAAEVAKLLSIKLTSRSWEGTRVLMCGFPIIHLDKYLKVLVQHHKRFVAMCQEFRRPTTNPLEKSFDRRVVRVLTPGTLIDESFVNHYQNNYLLAVGQSPGTVDGVDGQSLGLAWMDVSTGEFFVQQCAVDGLRDEVARIGPQEVVLNEELQENAGHPVRQILAEEGVFLSYIAPLAEGLTAETNVLPTNPSGDDVTSVITGAASEAVSATLSRSSLSPQESSAISLLTSFLRANLMEHAPRAIAPARQTLHNRMQIDSHTIKALEIREGIREGGATGSLLSCIKRTATSSGARLLARWLCSPSTSIQEIQARQGLVSLFLSQGPLRADVTDMLRRIEDASRIVQRFLLGRGDTDDLTAIKDTIQLWDRIKRRIESERSLEAPEPEACAEWDSLFMLLNKMKDLSSLAQQIELAVYERVEKPSPTTDVTGMDDTPASEIEAAGPLVGYNAMFRHSIKPAFSARLRSLHEQLQSLREARATLEDKLQKKYEAPSLTLRSSPGHGFHVHIGKAKRDLAKIEQSTLFVPISQSSTTKSFFHQEWFHIGNATAATVMGIQAAERHAFESLRAEVNAQAAFLRRNARIIDEIDVTLSFAELAEELKFVRPNVHDRTSYHVENGRHPSVELGLQDSGRMFTPNTVHLIPESRLHIITGPNMAGKSTLLRQTALIAILAQIGSYVPADSAEIGIVDKVFSRVGAKDDLFRDRSTFMVEMLETAEILKKATERSLVIMDEVGRGTTVKDGLAIAFATVNHLYFVNRCRALFATHFHEVCDMLGYSEDQCRAGTAFPHVGFYCTDVDELEDGHFTYSHQLRPGVNRDSHGLKVARLGGLPPSAIEIASAALQWLREREECSDDAKEDLRALGARLAHQSSRTTNVPY